MMFPLVVILRTFWKVVKNAIEIAFSYHANWPQKSIFYYFHPGKFYLPNNYIKYLKHPRAFFELGYHSNQW